MKNRPSLLLFLTMTLSVFSLYCLGSKEPRVSVDPVPVRLGVPFKVQGDNFVPGVNYTIYYVYKDAYHPVATVVADRSGSFTAGCTQCSCYAPATHPWIGFAVGETGSRPSIVLSFAPPFETPELSVEPTPVRLGVPFEVHGSNFAPGEGYGVFLVRRVGDPYEDLLTWVSADGSGNFTTECVIESWIDLEEPRIELVVKEASGSPCGYYWVFAPYEAER